MTRPAARIAVVLLHYADFAQRYLAPCYASLRRQTHPRELFEVFIVGNGVSPDTRAYAAQTAPEARHLQNASNLGWCGGNNTAIRVALGEDFDAVALLNMDTVVEPDWLATLAAASEASPDLHILQSTIMLNGTNRFHSRGNRIHYLGFGYCNGYGTRRSDGHAPYVVDYASGASMLVKREVFDAVGLFWDELFSYYDDMEFSWRARLAGFNVGMAERSVCHHDYDFRSRLSQLYHYQRNRLLTLLTLERAGSILLAAPWLLLSELALSVYFLARGWGSVVFGVIGYFGRPGTWTMIGARRRQTKRLRVRKDAEIVKRFSSRIVFAEVDHPLLRYLVNPLMSLYWGLVRRLIFW